MINLESNFHTTFPICNCSNTLTQADRSKLEAYEVWIWKRMEKISLVDKTNEEILNMIQEDRKI